MKKIILMLFLLMLSVNVSALASSSCKTNQIEDGQLALANVSYTLEYGENVIDMNGDVLDKYFIIRFPNLPEGYMAVLESGDESLVVTSASSFETLQGGVYKLKFYSYDCNTVIKSLEIKVPLYKLYCGETIDCDTDPWFDGTFENTASNQEGKKENKISTKLIIILVILILIIVFFIAVIIKRRRNLEKGL